MKLCTTMVAAVLIAGSLSTAQAQTLYWDINGTDPGVGNVGGFNDGDWDDVTTYWNTVADGTGAVQAWADNNTAVFSAGTDGTDAIITIPAAALPQNAAGLTIEEGMVEFQGSNGSIVLNANPSRVNNGAILQMPNTGFLIFTITAGQVMTLDGGTIRSKITGVGSGIWSGLGTIELTSLGGTLDTPNGAGGAYSIMAYTGTINLASGTTAATLTKKGPSELRLRNNNNFTTLDVQEGLLRVDGTGGTTQSLGALTGTVMVAGGAVENTTNGAAIGTSIGMTGAAGGQPPSPATRSFVLTGTGATVDSMVVLNASLTINGPISGAGGLMLNGWARNDGGGTTNIIGSQTQTLTLGGTNTYGGATTVNFGTLVATGGSAIPDTSRVDISTRSNWGGNNGGVVTVLNTAIFRVSANETIGSLSGGNATRGETNINGAAVTLTTGADNTSSTYSGSITGTGSLAKTGTGTFTMDGVKSYTGDTSVLGGTLRTNSASLADTADVFLTTGSIFDLSFAATDTIDSLFIDAAMQATGTWGAVGSGAAHETALITGTGLLNVSVGPGLPGDYNGDGTVDQADYVLWRKDPASHGGNPAGYNTWVQNFGEPGGAGAGGGGAVPEPTSVAMVVIAVAALVGRRRGQ
ncbi:MAG: autotransporter-associated beta strand repeat-containing protein [Planctomycetes bacterium]|nr:autotransporter-associated beta strand repeat-containing protein [Planctomycetota bacterium]